MGTGTLISVQEYLASSYQDGDREYVDGEIMERNLGEKSHGRTQGNVYYYLRTNYRDVLWAGPEIRVQVKPNRFRVPDVLAMLGPEPEGEIVATPPFIVIEVQSKDDRAQDLQEKIEDYLESGVSYVWVLNPAISSASVYSAHGLRRVNDGVLRTQNPEITVPLSEIFSK